jgi:hypothetical protein
VKAVSKGLPMHFAPLSPETQTWWSIGLAHTQYQSAYMELTSLHTSHVMVFIRCSSSSPWYLHPQPEEYCYGVAFQNLPDQF